MITFDDVRKFLADILRINAMDNPDIYKKINYDAGCVINWYTKYGVHIQKYLDQTI